MSRRLAAIFAIAFASALVLVACSRSVTPGTGTQDVNVPGAQPAGSPAAFTSFDTSKGGCLDSPNGVDCNNYVTKDDVYMNGGPKTACLADGSYFFAVVEPGSKTAALVDGSTGNLSQDAMSARTFSVTGCAISYGGPHALGVAANGQTIIDLMPYADTSNPGGVYQLVVCVEGATSVSQCKSDNFQISTEESGGGADGGSSGGTSADMAHVGPCQ